MDHPSTHELSRREMIKKLSLLLGASISSNNVISAIMDFKQNNLNTTGLGEFFTRNEILLVAELSEIIIPTTDTPGAKAANVHWFIDHMLFHCISKDEANNFRAGLKLLDDHSRDISGFTFVQQSKDIQVSMIEELDLRVHQHYFSRDLYYRLKRVITRNIMTDIDKMEMTFFILLKKLVTLGYYTSEIGATEELSYLPVPGNYIACISFSEIGRAWAR